VVKEGSCIIKQLNEKFPLLVNNQATKEHNLQNNDVINVGKHYIVYTKTESFIDTPQSTLPHTSQDVDVIALNAMLDQVEKQPEANLQVMDGLHIGRILPLKKAMTRLGRDGAGVVVIARRKDGYYVSALQGNDNLSVNKQALGDQTLLLKNNDIIEVDKIPMLFFIQ
jgi:hypothetical protein